MPMPLDCRTCGACCVGDLDDGYGFATVSASDLVRMSRVVRGRLHRDRSIMGEEYLSTPGVVTEEFGKSCAFLRGTPGRRCSCGIYETRPDVCRTYKLGGRGCKSARRDLGLEDADA